MNPKRGEIWRVQFRPAVGAEIQKVRPAVIMNIPQAGRLPLDIVVPITGWKPEFEQLEWLVNIKPTKVNGLEKESVADTYQVKSLSRTRLETKIGDLDQTIVDSITTGIAFCIGYGGRIK